MYEADVFIAGGGPAGLAAAIAANQRGLRVVLADAAGAPVDKCCGEGLLPAGVAALRQLGIGIPENAAPFRGIRLIEGSTFPPRVRTAQADFPHGCAYGIRRIELHRLLAEHAQRIGVDCRWNSPVTGLDNVNARWIIGADGGNSLVRKQAGLDAGIRRTGRRYGFRRHFECDRWGDYMELHWSRDFQVFVTPVQQSQVCVAVTSYSHSIRVDHALSSLPDLRARLARPLDAERGALTGTVSLQKVYRNNVALAGDASGSADSITGEGLSLAFNQATSLADAICEGNLAAYQKAHRQIARVPAELASGMLLLANHQWLRSRVLKLLESRPSLFAQMLAAAAGERRRMAPLAAQVLLGLVV